MAHVHRIGDPENASETKAIKELAQLLPDTYFIFHNFELTTGRGLPYEYDMAVVGDFAVWHVEVKGYRGKISGDTHQWVFENGNVRPSPIPLANKKTKILSSKLTRHSRSLEKVWVETCVLLTDDKAKIRLKDDQAGRVITLGQALDHFTDPKKIPVQVNPIERHHNTICEALFGSAKAHRRLKKIGLYDIIERVNQAENRTVFLAKHRYLMQGFEGVWVTRENAPPASVPGHDNSAVDSSMINDVFMQQGSSHLMLTPSNDLLLFRAAPGAGPPRRRA